MHRKAIKPSGRVRRKLNFDAGNDDRENVSKRMKSEDNTDCKTDGKRDNIHGTSDKAGNTDSPEK